ncbi:MAG: 3-phosphoshikimate 1-carboxyvinyltransferase, partial [Lachnospiraceae bacterium]|nr:3-phosphoshikimate 1-carboxyvinyltransferase [Lachnospiraceae bacterium]
DGAFPVFLECDGVSADIEATGKCLSALGAGVRFREDGIGIRPLRTRESLPADTAPDSPRRLYCGESGSTLRFLLPLAGALGADAVFHREGRLPARPLFPLDALLRAHGMVIEPDGRLLFASGQLRPGAYRIPGNISSQYITGLLFALPLLPGDSTLAVTDRIESADYIAITEEVLRDAGIRFGKEADGRLYRIPGNQRYGLDGRIPVERDWSGAAFPLCLGALSPQGVTVPGLNLRSSQGDRRILEILRAFGAQVSVRPEGALHRVTVSGGPLSGITLDASPVPDLVPVISVVAAAAHGTTRITHAERLRIKESDRIASTAALLRAIGTDVEERPDGLVIRGQGRDPGAFPGKGTASFPSPLRVDPANDHRIAMAAAVAASFAPCPVTVAGAECVRKSFPDFWEKYASLQGGS